MSLKEFALATVGTATVSEAAAGSRGNIYLMSLPRTPIVWSATSPPPMLIHGTVDTDVPYQESKDMDARLQQVGVEHDLVTVQGADHGLAGAKPEDRKLVTEKSVQWIQRHLG